MRKLAREVAFKMIFENLFANTIEFCEESFLSLCEENAELDENDRAFVKNLVSTYIGNKDSVQEEISKWLRGFTIDRIAKIDLAILSLAITELEFVKDVDEKIVINESVNLAKKYGEEKSHKFVNGVLASIVRKE